MRFWPEVHWSEGQFLRPHHFQAAFRQIETARAAATAGLHPYAWGFLSLDLATEAIENHQIEIRSCELLLRDGTLVKIPENCTLDPRDFKAAFDQSSGPMPVYFGVPELQPVRPNVQRPGELLDGGSPRYTIDLSERYDENTGENPQTIEVRRLRGAVFFGEEDRTGYDCVRLGHIERTAAGPTLAKNDVPPLLRMSAWGPLCAATEGLWNDIRARCEQLGGDAADRALTFATGSPGDIEQLIKLQALNELTVRFGALVSSPELHPHVLYMTLCDAIGRVTLWDDMRRPRELPSYNHSECGPVFEELFKYLRALVNSMLPKDYIERPFEQKTDGYAIELDYEWFTPNHEMYLGIRSPLQTEEILSLFRSINFKLASPRDALEVYRRRLPGLEFKSAGTVPNLPKSADQHYFRISRTPPYWEHCETERGIFIAMPPNDMPKLDNIKLSLFVVKTR
ncbi:MAG: type VI secretion system baseplate subunit TssK [Planctomycetota bacterium]|nr:MAG: type VI secretion system baseplate subunit TssK [Planctomycetota bacterium]